jgi:hypothetical protein
MTTTLETPVATTTLKSFYDLPGDPASTPGDDFARLAYNGYGTPGKPDFATPTASGTHTEGRAEVYFHDAHGNDSAVLVLTDALAWHAYVIDDFIDAVYVAGRVFRLTEPEGYDGEPEVRSVPAMLSTVATLPGVAFELGSFE